MERTDTGKHQPIPSGCAPQLGEACLVGRSLPDNQHEDIRMQFVALKQHPVQKTLIQTRPDTQPTTRTPMRRLKKNQGGEE